MELVAVNDTADLAVVLGKIKVGALFGTVRAVLDGHPIAGDVGGCPAGDYGKKCDQELFHPELMLSPGDAYAEALRWSERWSSLC